MKRSAAAAALIFLLAITLEAEDARIEKRQHTLPGEPKYTEYATR